MSYMVCTYRVVSIDLCRKAIVEDVSGHFTEF